MAIIATPVAQKLPQRQMELIYLELLEQYLPNSICFLALIFIFWRSLDDSQAKKSSKEMVERTKQLAWEVRWEQTH